MAIYDPLKPVEYELVIEEIGEDELSLEIELEALAKEGIGVITLRDISDYPAQGFALSDHNHDAQYSPVGHTHDDRYSQIGHVHDGVYSPVNHDHDDRYSQIGHNHNGLYEPADPNIQGHIADEDIHLSTEQSDKLESLGSHSLQKSEIIKFDKQLSLMDYKVDSNVAFVPDEVTARPGFRAMIKIIGDGEHTVDLSAFKKSGGSFDYDVNMINHVVLWCDGIDYWYRIFEQVIPGDSIQVPEITDEDKIYPGAKGYGTDSKGAYASETPPTILIVDTLDAGNFSTGTNRGTFQWACEQNYPRIIVFEVGGVIDYSSQNSIWRIQIENPYLNVYGQTAPGEGITVKGVVLWLQASDMLFQHIRFRPGDYLANTNPNSVDAVNMYVGAQRIVFNHCSFSWSIDELVGTRPTGNEDITFSDCIFAEPLDMSWHYDEDTDYPERHPYGVLMNGSNTSFLRNLFAYMMGRAPLVRNGYNQIINNLNYAGLWACPMLENTTGDMFVDVINNHIINIPYMGVLEQNGDYAAYIASYLTANSRLFISGNICNLKIQNPELDDWETVRFNERVTKSETPLTDISGLDILPAEDVFDYVLNHAGAFYWERDNVDASIIQKVRTNAAGEFRHSAESLPARARNEDRGSQTHGDLSAGYDWANNPETLVISYTEEPDGPMTGPVTINLTQACADISEVVNYLNSILPSALSARVIGNNVHQTPFVEIITDHVGDGAAIEVHATSTCLATFGMEAKVYYGQTNESQINNPASHTLNLPAVPHSDDNLNSYTAIQEYAYERQENWGALSGTPISWPFSKLDHNHDDKYSPIGHNHDGKYAPVSHNHDADYAKKDHTHTLDSLGVGDFATKNFWKGTSAEFAALPIKRENVVYFIEDTTPGEYKISLFEMAAKGCLGFSDASDYVEVPYDPDLDFGMGSFTVEFWVKGSPTNTHPFFVQKTNGALNGFGISANTSNGNHVRAWRGSNNYLVPQVQTDVLDGNWHHVAVVFNDTGRMELYVDGIYDGYTDAPILNSNLTASMFFGNSLDITGRSHDGEIADVRIWKKTKSHSEILEGINKKLYGDEQDLVAYFRFDEGSGTITKDYVKGMVGTLNGTITWGTHPGITISHNKETGMYLKLGVTNFIRFSDSIIETPTDNKWAYFVRVRNFVPDYNVWGALIGRHGASGSGAILMTRLANAIQYRDTLGDYHTITGMAAINFSKDGWMDLMVWSDGTSIYISLPHRDIQIPVTETPEITNFGAAHSVLTEGVEIEVSRIIGWNLEGYAGPFTRDGILGITPTHEFEIEEGNGLTIYDKWGNITGTINQDEEGLWNS